MLNSTEDQQQYPLLTGDASNLLLSEAQSQLQVFKKEKRLPLHDHPHVVAIKRK